MATKQQTPLHHARQVLDIELAGLKAVRSQLDGQFTATVGILKEALRRRNKLVVVGIGKSGNIGQKISATFNSTGATSVLLDPANALHGDIGLLDEGDVVLALSYSGESDELLSLMAAIKKFPVQIVALTGAPKSALAKLSDVVLNAKVPKEACPFNLAPTASTTAMLALGDALAMALLQARGFKKKDFARYHPSGAIGRALLLHASDIMRTGRRLATASREATIREALLIMTRAKSGSVCVVGKTGKLVGVFTDGDLRRLMAKSGDAVLKQSLCKVMTTKPTTLRDSALAVEALKVFHTRKIDDLIVINAKREPIGMIDSQDLPKLKLA
ncbi:MAG: KpsF/GutQ family sugar-phosphate isomerase [Verrucomicrobiota bacterium]|jgi:arabinose-5-phosphate isomerase|nr:KpsF/GutQ family sugar-phosphate isomerase [Verrucomicrobiota bacterium]MEE2714412.1 KpsF/GutQ family sugar-phosphate isomerase [Verrucomicrobiota bacterium]MEE2814026.1 KpsF/GutQ family sugar-phosphate isomerase [Verrucomicrobiota bacterium]